MNEMSTRRGSHGSWKYVEEEGRHKTLEMNLDDQVFMLPLDTSLTEEGEG